MALKSRKSEIHDMQQRLRDKFSDAPATSEANGSLEDLGFQEDVGTKWLQTWVTTRQIGKPQT